MLTFPAQSVHEQLSPPHSEHASTTFERDVVQDTGLRVGFRVQGSRQSSGYSVSDIVQGTGFRIGFRVHGFGYESGSRIQERVQGAGFRVQGAGLKV